MHITISLASNVTNELVTGWCITERVKRLSGNEIELGMMIPTIESQASNIPMTKGIVYGIAWILNIVVHPMRSSWSMWEPTWVSRSRCWLLTEERLGHVCMVPEPVGSTHLRFDDTRVIRKTCMWLPNVVRSPGWDPERYEEFRNGPEVKIYIWEVIIRSPERFGGISCDAPNSIVH